MLSELLHKQLIENEAKSVDEYVQYLCSIKLDNKIGWQDIADLVSEKFNFDRSERHYRRYYSQYVNKPADSSSTDKSVPFDDLTYELQKERVKTADVNNQFRAYIRKVARDESIKECINKAVLELNNKAPLLKDCKVNNDKLISICENEGLLQLSDWHYGIEFENAWNRYNPEVTVSRLNSLLQQVLNICKVNNINTLHVMNLSDLIAGRIHLTIRLESRFDVITQIIKVSELLAEFLKNLMNNGIYVHYYSCADNHSRIEPKKDDAMNEESLHRITDWYLYERLSAFKDKMEIHSNKFGADIITFNCLGHSILGLHGHKDKPDSVIDSISRMTHNTYDLICTAHRHHFSADEKNETIVISNGTLMGTDTYAVDLRVSSKPSQNLIVISKDNVAKSIYRILV